LTDTHLGRQMYDSVAMTDRCGHQCRVADIPLDELYVRRQGDWLAIDMYLFVQTIHHTHEMAALQQGAADVASDEAGSAGNQNATRHNISFPNCSSAHYQK
jgi:hypothetical protein